MSTKNKFNSDNCVGCGQCIENCLGGAFTGGGSYSVNFIPDLCLDCSPCQIADLCPGECFN
jgi:NAD-dependent dihydropyrimidine dehydrogenase PreA subunit